MVIRIKTDAATFFANKKNETFLVDANANLLFLNDSLAVSGQSPVGGRTFRIEGTLTAAKDPANAIDLQCSAKNTERILVGPAGEINATFDAVQASGGLIDIRNAGKIEGGFSAMALDTHIAKLRNSGTIEGGTSSTLNMLSDVSVLRNSGLILSLQNTAMSCVDGDTKIFNEGTIEAFAANTIAIVANRGDFELHNNGTIIAAAVTGVALRPLSLVENVHIINDGIISGGTGAIVATTQPSSNVFEIINRGEMIGDVNLTQSQRNDLVDTSNGRVQGDILTGAGNDRIVLINAIVSGVVNGELGDDVYTVSSSTIVLAEAIDAGTDTVRATGNVSITLAANFENAVLIGKNDTQATGNNLDNILTGNSGNNVLNGAAGKDTLRGGKGRDELIGGSDIDTFIYGKGDGKDVIQDFNIALVGNDFLDLSGIKGITDFDDLIDNHARDVDGDVVINAGKGDQVILEGLTVAELRAELFFL